jgi:ATP-dependent Clp protease ATP-binding subunit ClpA
MAPSARAFLGPALAESRRLGHGYLGTEHLLLALAADPEGRAAAVLRGLGVTAADVEADLLELVGSGPGPTRSRIDRDALAALGIDLDEVRSRLEATFGAGALERTQAGCTPICPRAKLALQLASEEAAGETVESDDLLLSLLRVSDSVAAEILQERGVTLDGVRAALANE